MFLVDEDDSEVVTLKGTIDRSHDLTLGLILGVHAKGGFQQSAGPPTAYIGTPHRSLSDSSAPEQHRCSPATVGPVAHHYANEMALQKTLL